MTSPPVQDASLRAGRSAGGLVLIAVLILAPIVALMWVGSYARATPRLWGMPFFFWYQFLWVFLAAGCTFAAYRILIATTPPRRPFTDRDDAWDEGRPREGGELP